MSYTTQEKIDAVESDIEDVETELYAAEAILERARQNHDKWFDYYENTLEGDDDGKIAYAEEKKQNAEDELYEAKYEVSTLKENLIYLKQYLTDLKEYPDEENGEESEDVEDQPF